MRGRTLARGALAVSLLLLPGARTVATNPRVVTPPVAPPAATGITPSAWHRQRRAAILAEHPEVRGLIGQDARTLPALAVANVAQLGAAFGAGHAHLPPAVLLPLGLLVGGTLSLWQFACLHDIKHGTATMIRGTKINDVLFYGSMPSLFGYYLYLRYGHLSHHREFGTAPIAQLFDSSQAEFEDGDVMFVAHRQRLKGDPAEKRVEAVGEAVGGLGVSISRSFYAFAWTDAAGWAGAAWNAAVYSTAMTMERAALCVNEKVRSPSTRHISPSAARLPSTWHAPDAGGRRVRSQLLLPVQARRVPSDVRQVRACEHRRPRGAPPRRRRAPALTIILPTRGASAYLPAL